MIAVRMLTYAVAALVIAVAAWIAAIVVLEWARVELGVEVDDLTLAQVELVTYVGAPIIGAWFAWVRR